MSKQGKVVIEEEIIHIPTASLAKKLGHEPSVCTETLLLKKGSVKAAGNMALPCDIVLDRDVPIRLRDGITVYGNVFRPANDHRVPAILSYGPFGKDGINAMTPDFGEKESKIGPALTSIVHAGDPETEQLPGVEKKDVSGYAVFECADPAHWVPYDYAIVNVDARGVGMSEGNSRYFGTADAEDACDVIEWIAQQPWCSGKVTLSGNSWYAINQWHIAVLKPEHLVCIAPWEGGADLYREEYLHGGIPRDMNWVSPYPAGLHMSEFVGGMMQRYPLMNSYWLDKIVDFEDVDLPAYVVASYSNVIHTHGTLDGFRRLGSKEKWLRIHNTNEWHDYYQEANRDDLRKFYDHYMKGIDNGWEKTPRVRMAVLDPGGEDIIDRVEEEFPLKRQEVRRIYLDASDMTGKDELPEKEVSASYQSDDNHSMAEFRYVFQKDTEISGFWNARLWMSAEEADDMDIFVCAAKCDRNGNEVFQNSITYYYPGPQGRLRASHRALEPKKSTELEPYHTHTCLEKLSAGEIVCCEIGLWPTSMLFHEGEQLRIRISGFDTMYEKPTDRQKLEIHNKGKNRIHTGGRYDSCLIVPYIPAD